MLLSEGVDPTVAIGNLLDMIRRLEQVKGSWTGPGDWQQVRHSYLEVLEVIEQSLQSLFEDDDGVGARLYGEHYKMIREMDRHTPRPSPLINAEIKRQERALEALMAKVTALRGLRQRPGHPVILDTNALMHYHRLDKIPWAEVLGLGQVRLILPICVIDELDNKKYAGSDLMSRRADQALRALRQRGKELRPGSAAVLEDGTTLEVFLDEPDHQRKINLDAELLSRGTLLQRMIGRAVTIVTGDFGMQLRIDAQGLDYAEMPEKYSKDALRRKMASDAEDSI